MKINEIICEVKYSDARLRTMGWDGSEDERCWYPPGFDAVGATTKWRSVDAIVDILGIDFVTDDEDDVQPGQVLVYNSGRTLFIDHEDMAAIEIRDMQSKAAIDVAKAVHEAYHAYMWIKAQGGQIHANEKFVNTLATRWLRAHLSGPELHVALETILKSKISYGHN